MSQYAHFSWSKRQVTQLGFQPVVDQLRSSIIPELRIWIPSDMPWKQSIINHTSCMCKHKQWHRKSINYKFKLNYQTQTTSIPVEHFLEQVLQKPVTSLTLMYLFQFSLNDWKMNIIMCHFGTSHLFLAYLTKEMQKQSRALLQSTLRSAFEKPTSNQYLEWCDMNWILKETSSMKTLLVIKFTKLRSLFSLRWRETIYIAWALRGLI